MTADKQKAFRWWTNLPPKEKELYAMQYYKADNVNDLTIIEIINLMNYLYKEKY